MILVSECVRGLSRIGTRRGALLKRKCSLLSLSSPSSLPTPLDALSRKHARAVLSHTHITRPPSSSTSPLAPLRITHPPLFQEPFVSLFAKRARSFVTHPPVPLPLSRTAHHTHDADDLAQHPRTEPPAGPAAASANTGIGDGAATTNDKRPAPPPPLVALPLLARLARSGLVLLLPIPSIPPSPDVRRRLRGFARKGAHRHP
jgi:hypothetical protein